MTCMLFLWLVNNLTLMVIYKKEVDYVVLSKAIDVCYNVLRVIRDVIPDLVNAFKEFFINLLLFSAQRLGWEPVPGESYLNALLREEVFMALAAFDHNKTHKEAMQRFQIFLNDKNTLLLSADTKRAVYVAVMRNASITNRNGFMSLLKIYRETDAVHEKERILRTIASSPNLELVEEVLNFLISDEVRDQDIVCGLAGISLEGCEIAWRWLKENWNLIIHKYGDGILLRRLVADIISPFCSNEKADEIEEFFVSHRRPSFEMTLKRMTEQIRIKARCAETKKQEQQSVEDLLKQLAHKG